MPKTPAPHDKYNPYTQISNRLIHDRNLSLQALGLITYFLSKRDDHYFTIRELIFSHTNGRASLRSTINELISHGYLFKYRLRNPNNLLSTYYFSIFEHSTKTTTSSIGHLSTVDNSAFGNSTVGDSPIANNKIVLKTKKDKTTTPTNVVNTDVGVFSKITEKERIELLDLFLKLGIMSSKKMFDKFNNRDILKYTRWMYNEKIEADNPTGYLISACQRKFVIKSIPQDRKKIPGNFIYQCKKCLEPFGYDSKISNYEFCNTCSGRTF